jgi:hypothetical protein
MEPNWCKYEGDSVLLVEGANDCHVTLALCKKHHIDETFGIYECGSDDKALKRMNALIASPNRPKTIGLLLDADRPNLAGRWASVQQKLLRHKIQLPPVPALSGTIVAASDGLPRLGVWLMPNNVIDGMLEDFCKEMIDSEAAATVEQCLTIAEQSGHTSFKQVHRSKAFVHTYLAWQDEPGRPLGQAITASVLSGDTPTANNFVQWLAELFR